MNNTDNNIWESNQPSSYIPGYVQGGGANTGVDVNIRRIVATWPFMILFGIISYALGNLYLRYATVQYTVSTSISLEQKDEMSLNKILVGNVRDPFNDKVAFFKSPTLALQLVDSLGLQYNAIAQGRFKDKNFYKVVNWRIITAPNQEPPLISFTIINKKNGFHFVSDGIEGDAKWGIPFMIKKNQVVIEKTRTDISQTPILCFNQNKLDLAFYLSSKIVVSSNQESNIVNIKYTDNVDQRAIDILNMLVALFDKEVKKDKSLAFSQAIAFIDTRLEPLRSELDSIENSLAAIKASRSISGDGSYYLGQLHNYEQEFTRMDILKTTINSIRDYINNPKTKDPNLSFLGLENSGLPTMLSQFQTMRMERDRLALTVQSTNPTLILVNKNLSDLRESMEAQLSRYEINLKIARDEYEGKMKTASEFLKKVPFEERELLDKTRFQNIKEALYLSLLQKREEAAIAKASITVGTKILTPPLKSTASVSPTRKIILSIFFFVGLIIPVIFALLKEVLNKKIISKKQLQGLTPIPVIGELEQTENNKSDAIVIGSNKRSMFGEQIRTLRTNMTFYLPQNNTTNYIMITSSVSGEGKSFLSSNIAKSYAIQGKKVALLEFDLRRPKITKALKLPENIPGLSALLIGKYTPEEVKYPLETEAPIPFDFYPAGYVPPNPQELVSGVYMDSLKAYLDANYEIVIIDTPPLGIVADAQIIGKWADLALIVTRFNQTVKEQIQEINEWKEKGYFKNMALIFNGVKNKGYFGYKYGYYYYKRKYGYGYYSYGTEGKKRRSVY